MKQIYKYRIEDSDLFHRNGDQAAVATIGMPAGAKILSAHAQEDFVNVWALVDPEGPRVKRGIVIVGTGFHIVDTGLEFVGTVILREGLLVLHVFDAGEFE